MNAKELDEFILGNFGGVEKDNPWESEPEFTVFRHTDNRKWLALRFYASREQLLRLKPDDAIIRGYGEGERVDIVNLKIDPDMISDVVKMPGFLPAYHMNRRYWVSVVLDKEVDTAKLKPLIEMSCLLTSAKTS